jgi:hypothetical protein
MADREIHTHTTTGGGSGVGILGVIIGALLVIGAIVFITGGFNIASNEGGGGTSVTINAPEAPKAPAAPGGPATTGAR